jgi:hypothetical protein
LPSVGPGLKTIKLIGGDRRGSVQGAERADCCGNGSVGACEVQLAP